MQRINERKGARARALGAAAALAALTALPGLSRAEPMSLRYDIIVGGMKAMKMTYDGDIGPKSYKAHVVIKPTGGLLSLFIKKSFDLGGSGAVSASGARPSVFYMTIKKRKKLKKGTVRWKGGKLAWERTPTPSAGYRAGIFRAIGAGAPDPLSLVIGLSGRKASQSCRGTRRVFDAHDVYDLRLSLRGEKRISSAIYHGPAQLCRMDFAPVAGYSDKKRRKIRKHPWVFNVWLAPVNAGSAGKLMAPVAAFGSLDGHDFKAVLKRAVLAGRPLLASR